MLCETDDQKKIWTAIERRIDGQATNGLNAEGNYSENIAMYQHFFVLGLRAARLTAINAISERGSFGEVVKRPVVLAPDEMQDMCQDSLKYANQPGSGFPDYKSDPSYSWAETARRKRR